MARLLLSLVLLIATVACAFAGAGSVGGPMKLRSPALAFAGAQGSAGAPSAEATNNAPNVRIPGAGAHHPHAAHGGHGHGHGHGPHRHVGRSVKSLRRASRNSAK
eukprot:157186-Rhodomonas_salina.1